MTEHEKYQEHIRHTHDAFCKTVIRHAAISFLRILIYTIINQYEVENAIIRRLEDNAQKVDLGRANIEGVIQELISNCRVHKYKTL